MSEKTTVRFIFNNSFYTASRRIIEKVAGITMNGAEERVMLPFESDEEIIAVTKFVTSKERHFCAAVPDLNSGFLANVLEFFLEGEVSKKSVEVLKERAVNAVYSEREYLGCEIQLVQVEVIHRVAEPTNLTETINS